MSVAKIDREFDVIIIGGGITGAGTARDCALRGLKVLLLERNDIADGATGRNHGLLHSGARYAVTDEESATECIKENTILRKVARNCVEETEGLFITLPEDDLAYQDKFVAACLKAGIKAEKIDPAEARIMEPSVNPNIIGAVKVPDGSVDPFRLCSANITDAKLHGATILTYTEVDELIQENGTVLGVKARDKKSGERREFRAPVTINAAGIWGALIAEKAGVRINMFPAKGSLLVFGHRVNNMVINRCRKPANADILVPGDTVCVIGTTSTRVSFEECDEIRATNDEVDLLLKEGALLAPALASTRILRAYAGVRPLVASDADPSGRSISRGIVLLDHESRDGLRGFVSITGGKLMTYRLMAEMAANLVCRKLHKPAICVTASTPLPGSESMHYAQVTKRLWAFPSLGQKALSGRLGDRASLIKYKNASDKALVCECEEVTLAEVENAIENLGVNDLIDLRRRTRVGMGTCQGALCACRAAGLIDKAGKCSEAAREKLGDFLQERWKGMYSVAWGDTLRESQYSQMIYKGLCGLEKEER